MYLILKYASCERHGSKPEIKLLLPFLKNITEESNLENFQDPVVVVDACCWLHKAISITLSRFGDKRKADAILGGDFHLPLC